MANTNPGKLILVRHGMSEWNKANKFTGWTDVPLAEEGKQEAHKAAELLQEFTFDKAFTSDLIRAQDTLSIILEDLEQSNIPIEQDQALNERHYGDLQGKNKDEMRKEVGEEQVHLWRRSYDVAPPNGESLKDTCDRTIPYLKENILPEVQAGKTIIVSAHGNSLRSIVKELEDLSGEAIVKVEIPTGVPYIYEFDQQMHIANKTILHHNVAAESKETHQVQ